MKPTIGSRAAIKKHTEVKKLSASRQFVEINTHNNIVMKSEFLYLEDVKEAINITALKKESYSKDGS